MDEAKTQKTIKELRARVTDLALMVEALQERNTKVEADKAWETSRVRILLISVLTYLLTSIVFYLIGVPHYMRNAFIPTIGYFLSTQTIPRIREWWLNFRKNS